MGFVYVLTNAEMPGLVKIGITTDSDPNVRIAQLYTTGVPLPFEVEYLCEVDNPGDVEKALHEAFEPHRVNPKREFFRLEPSQAIVILRLLNKSSTAREVTFAPTGIDAESLAAVEQAKARRPHLNFEEMGIPIGAVLNFVDKEGVTVTVTAPKKVKIADNEVTLTAATRELLGLGYDVRPTPHWRYEGRLLTEIYNETYSPSE